MGDILVTHSSLFADRYQILVEHRKGGTAKIFKALDAKNHSFVALKIFGGAAFDPAIIDAIWDRECSSLAKLNHPSIVKMLDAGRDTRTNERYIALEWVDGQTLEQHLSQTGALSWDVFNSRIGRDLLSAMLHVAERNITHRDLSTSNVLIQPTGKLKVIDFGQAKLQTSQAGRTVMGFKTIPYCPPEEDTGAYTHTRDPFSYCSIVIRAIHGQPLNNHDELYQAATTVDIPPDVFPVIEKAISRDPKERFPTIIEFEMALNKRQDKHPLPEELIIPIRLDPVVLEKLTTGVADDIDSDPLSLLITELNDVACISPANDKSHLTFETRSYRLTAHRDQTSLDALVVVRAIRKHFKVDALLRPDRWQPEAKFTTKLPRHKDEKRRAVQAIDALYEGLEEFLQEAIASERINPEDAYVRWSNLLEAMRFVAKNAAPEVRYTDIRREGRRLIVTVETPSDLAPDELRTISVNGSWVFRGEVEDIKGNICTLVSTRPTFDIERIPNVGTLEIDWQQTRAALDRQGRALDKFKGSETPNRMLASLLTGSERGPNEASYGSVSTFFDPTLDDSKKLIAAQYSASPDLIVVHGPPGTGKTKLIVELVRQTLSTNPDSRILLASQTHVALDNALERLLKADPKTSCVRIGSGAREASPNVAMTSVEQRSLELRDNVTKSAQHFLIERATQLGVDQREVELGLAATELISALEEESKHKQMHSQLLTSKTEVTDLLDKSTPSTSDRQSAIARTKQIDQALSDMADELAKLKAAVIAASSKLAAFGTDGAALTRQSVDELKEWTDLVLFDTEEKRAMGELIRLSESWRLRFAQSEDFKSAIIASSSVVAGTCVGFCREEAAVRTVFDVCIVDEAAKATTTELLVPLAQARKAVLFGDHHQLPAVLDYEITSPALLSRFNVTKQQIEEQLFETLTKDLAPGSTARLQTQHRMRGEIGRLVSDCFYEGSLVEGASIETRKRLDLGYAGLSREVTWLIPYTGQTARALERRQGKSFDNYVEASAIVSLLKRISFAIDNSSSKLTPSIGVISGYAAQVLLIQNLIRKEKSLDKLEVECASVHAFQGREVDVCIYSVTRRNENQIIGMIKDWRHLNVALSRAKEHLVIVGDITFCENAVSPNPFQKVINFIRNSPLCSIKEHQNA